MNKSWTLIVAQLVFVPVLLIMGVNRMTNPVRNVTEVDRISNMFTSFIYFSSAMLIIL